ncbi:unnamed protein product [Echinostoma caproni]|uniref:UPF0029 domain-containing protein n=1 Tax=Echinostoma caproni TaxID=27848 RepID=A0A183AX82_9TREM|nr:unnamed protein product [Echinostoma caproni]
MLVNAKDVRICGLLGAARVIYELGGVRGFGRGLGARVLSAVPGTAISWSVYEYFKWLLKSKSNSPSSGSEAARETCSSTRSVFLPASREVSCAVNPSINRESLKDSIPNLDK